VPRVTVDFSEIETIEPLDKGEYSATITNVTYVEQEVEDKYPYLNAELTIDEPGFEGRKVWLIWSLSPKALFRMQNDFVALGIAQEEEELEIEYDDEAEPPVVTQPELVGLPCVVVMDKPRTWEGRTQNNPSMLRSNDDKPAAKGKKAPAGKKTTGGKKFK